MLFDLDGVLVSSFEVWFRCVEQAGLRYRGKAITREEFAPTFGQGTQADVREFGLSCTSSELDRFYAETFPRYLDQVWVDPEARPLLELLRARRLRTSLVTNTTTPLAHRILKMAKLDDLFDQVACADQVAHGKPAPDVVNRALALLDIPAGAAWMIGDSQYDVGAARAAGVHIVGLKLQGDARVESLAEFQARVERAVGSGSQGVTG